MSRHTLKLLSVFLILLLIVGCKSSDEAGLNSAGDTGEMTADGAVLPTEEGFSCSFVSEIPAAECQALAAFYDAAGGSTWNNHTGWLETTTPCSWYGVTCESGHVDMLTLHNNNLVGELPAALADLAQLRVLDLHTNGLSGMIPGQIGRLSHLVQLDLSANRLSGSLPVSLGELPALEWLILADNQFSGVIPAEIGNIGSLRNLDLSYNQFSGPIPESLAGIATLESVRLRNNQLSGSIPFGLGELTALSEIDLSFNELTGSPPSALFQVPIFRFWGNKLDGTIFLAESGPQDVNFLGAVFSFDQAVADSVWSELAPAQPVDSMPGILWTPPEHIVFTFARDSGPEDHMPLGQHLPAEAQIHIFPTAELNAEVQPIVDGLKQLLAEQADLEAYALPSPETDVEQIGLTMLPPSNARQTLRAQLQYLTFNGGKGIRYLTQLSQGPVPLSNQDVFYTFQGLTDDGATYVAAYFPVTVPMLPDNSELSEEEWTSLLEDWQGYLAGTLAMLNEQPSSAFTPDLEALDALVNSISAAGMTAVPTLEIVGPANEETVDSQPVLVWKGHPDAASYQVVVLDDAAFPPEVMIDRRVTEPMLVVDESLPPGHYSWTVWAYDKDDNVLAELNSTFIVADSK